MTIKRIRLILIITLSFILHVNGFTQYYLYNSDPINLDVKFLKSTIEAESNQSFFNVLKIKNNGKKTENFTLLTTVPNGWNVFGKQQQEITLNPYDSIFVPVRVSVHGKVKGDIGYSVIASLTDSRGTTIKNEYCFVKIKRKEELQVSIPYGINYFDQRTGLSNFTVKVSNKGNKEELVNFTFELDQGIGIGTNLLDKYEEDISIAPYTDTTLNYSIKLQDNIVDEREAYRVNFKAFASTKTFAQSVWFRIYKSEFRNFISSNDKLLTVELRAQGLMSEGKKPSYIGFVSGKVLLHRNSEIYYSYRNLSSYRNEDFYKYNQMSAGIKSNKLQFEIGDIFTNQESSLFGRGAQIGYKGSFLHGLVVANKNIRSNIENFGSFIGVILPNSNKIDLGFAYNKDITRKIESTIISAQSQIMIGTQSFFLLGAINPLKQKIDGKNDHAEYSWEFRHGLKFGKFRNTLRVRYGTPLYYGNSKGRLTSQFNSYFDINSKNRVTLFVVKNDLKSSIIRNDSIRYFNTTNSLYSRLLYNWDTNPKSTFFAGPGYEEYSKNFVVGDSVFPNDFVTRTFSLQFGNRFRFNDPYTSLTPKLTLGNVYFVDHPLIYGSNPSLYSNIKNLLIYYLDVSYRSKHWSFITSFESGPRNIYSQFNYFYNGRSTRMLRLNPSYNSFIYKNIILLDANAAYNNDMVLRNQFFNISLIFTWFLPKDWSAKLNTYYSVTKRTMSSGMESYQSIYLEAAVRKEFNIPHPRVRYFNMNLLFFKDFNGNRVQEPNEPGVKDVLVTLVREQDAENYEKVPGDVGSIEVLSDYLGAVHFENIPNGRYTIQYSSIGKDAGNFSKGSEDLSINLQENKTFYLPFIEKNKVFGKIILNRSRLSGLGKIDLSNVRISAQDSKGRVYTSLSDKNGDFVIYAPVTDEYLININNIFYENFDLRQNGFKVHFNGYKQFEVNFVFDEKIRRVNFSPSTQDPQLANILQVRRTNLRGSVKDESSLLPVRAKINLVNTKVNSVISSIYSSSITGDYNISFMAEENYLLEVLADGYWYHSENLNLNQVTTFLNITKDIVLKPIAIGSKIELNIKFDTNKKDLEPESVAELNRLIKLLKDNGNIKIEVQGHSDDLEALNNNQLSEDRAKIVARYLIENGFSNLQIRGFGNTMPISSNDTEQGRAANRRVEIEVVSK